MDYTNSINALKTEINLLRRDIETMQAVAASGSFFALPPQGRKDLYKFLQGFLPDGPKKDSLLSQLAPFLPSDRL